MKGEFSNRILFGYGTGDWSEEKEIQDVHRWFRCVNRGGNPEYWRRKLHLTIEEINLHRGKLGCEWKGIDVGKLLNGLN